MEIELELAMGPEIGTRTRDQGHGTQVSQDRSHRIGVIMETETEAKSWKQVIGNM
jgi:hypothetical protein